MNIRTTAVLFGALASVLINACKPSQSAHTNALNGAKAQTRVRPLEKISVPHAGFDRAHKGKGYGFALASQYIEKEDTSGNLDSEWKYFLVIYKGSLADVRARTEVDYGATTCVSAATSGCGMYTKFIKYQGKKIGTMDEDNLILDVCNDSRNSVGDVPLQKCNIRSPEDVEAARKAKPGVGIQSIEIKG
ncbi:MAG: hypothetical protein RL189_2810 [Pseudomonadota bacterium]|jgi:hypothetical protein